MENGYVTTVGMFDGVHLGHRSIISQTIEIAKRQGLSSLVVTFDRHPLSVISPAAAPLSLSGVEERVKLISLLGVDKVVVLPFDESLRQMTASQFIKDVLIDRLDTRILVIGHDHGFGSDRVRGIEAFSKIGRENAIDVIEASYWGRERVCSSAVREYLAGSDISSANRLLGRPYSISGTVVKGRQIGRTIGFPTANILPPPNTALPGRGVYAALISDGTEKIDRPAMVNIGLAPTVTDEGRLTIEAHILDFKDDLYGHNLNLKFIARLRDEKRFDSLEQLKKQLGKDLEDTLRTVDNYVENP